MGNSNSRRNGDKIVFNGVTTSEYLENECSPIYFNHKVHGENILVSEDKRVARRIRSYCKGICYSNRPINVNEVVSVKICETSDEWSGVLRFGFVSSDPNEIGFRYKSSQDTSSLNTQTTTQPILPKYSCPDLNNKNGNWAKALPVAYAIKENFLSFYYDYAGNVHYLINGLYKGIFNGINLKFLNNKSQLWAMFDIYGNTISLELICKDPYLADINGGHTVSDNNLSNIFLNGHNDTIKSPYKNGLNRHQSNVLNPLTFGKKANCPATSPCTLPSSISKYYHSSPDSDGLALFTVLPFHTHPNARGKNVHIVSLQNPSNFNGIREPNLERGFQGGNSVRSLHGTKVTDVGQSSEVGGLDCSSTYLIASRAQQEFCNAYAFTARPLKLNEKVLVKILATESVYVGSLAFGLTSCDPSTLHPAGCLPDEANFLIDRPEYWVVAKDLSPVLEVSDELAFYIDPQGQVIMEKNGFQVGTIMYVDTTQKLWAFWDLYGSAQKIRILGSYHITLGINELENQLQLRHTMTHNYASTNAPSHQPLTTQANSRPYVGGHLGRNNPYDHLDLISAANNSRSNESSSPGQAPLNSLIPGCIYEISPHFQSSNSPSEPVRSTVVAQNNGNINYGNTCSATQNGTNGFVHSLLGRHVGNGIDLSIARRPLKQKSDYNSNVLLSSTHTLPAQTQPSTHSPQQSSSSCNTVHSYPDRFQQYNTMVTKPQTPHSNNGKNSPLSRETTTTLERDESFVSANSSFSTPKNGGKGLKKSSTLPTTAPTSLTSNLLNQQECVVCYERSLDCLLYPCGHICMCYPCATQTWKMTSPGSQAEASPSSKVQPAVLGLCPICRSTIKEVVKIFLS